jgi:hypothetical protein
MHSYVDRSSQTARKTGAWRFLFHLWLTTVAVVVASSLAPPLALAQGQDPELCGEFETGLGEKDNSIKDCTGDLISEQLGLINAVDEFLVTMQGITALSYTREASELHDDLAERVRLLKSQHGRAQGANDDTEDLEYEELVEKADKETGGKCKFQEIEEYADAEEPEVFDFLPAGLENPDGKFSDGECNSFTAFDPSRGKDVRIHERSNNKPILR